jgi:rhodanese-related sulfurtransferase
MPRRNRDRAVLFPILRKPAMQLAIVIFIGFIIYLIALAGGEMGTSSRSNEVNVDEAYQMYQDGAFLLDVRTQQEWEEYHAPNSTSIPLDQLPGRLNELPRDRAILVVCSSAACSQQGRGILLSAGFNASSLRDGFDIWYTRGYPIEGAPPQ